MKPLKTKKLKTHLTPEGLGLFRNCKVEYFDYFANEYKIGTLQGIADDHHFWIKENHSGQDIDKCKPILRPISDITDAELEEYFLLDHSFEGNTISYIKFNNRDELEKYHSIRFNCEYVIDKTGVKTGMLGTISFRHISPKQFQYLLSKHFDIFGWIGSDLAIQSELQNVPIIVPDKNLFPPIS